MKPLLMLNLDAMIQIITQQRFNSLHHFSKFILAQRFNIAVALIIQPRDNLLPEQNGSRLGSIADLDIVYHRPELVDANKLYGLVGDIFADDPNVISPGVPWKAGLVAS